MDEPIDDKPNVSYIGQIVDVRRTQDFDKWLNGLRDRRTKLRLAERLDRLARGHRGDTKSVGDGVHELRFAFGPGYRIYYMWRGTTLVLLLLGGDKDSQMRDIAKAKALAKEIDYGFGNAAF